MTLHGAPSMVRNLLLAALLPLGSMAAAQEGAMWVAASAGADAAPTGLLRGLSRRLDTLEVMSESSRDILGSMVDAFLSEERLSQSSRACLVKGTKEFTAKVMNVSSHIVMLFQQILGQRKDMSGMPDASQLPLPNFTLHAGIGSGNEGQSEVPTTPPLTSEAPSTTDPEDQDSLSAFYGGRRLDIFGDGEVLMQMSSVFMEVGYSMQLLVKMTRRISKECITGKTLKALEGAAKHARDLGYVGGHFLANGADVVTQLSDAITAYKTHNYSRFGADVGTALRKIFLSNNSASLPRGTGGKLMMVNLSMGFVKGFFGKGFTLGIRLKQDPAAPLRIDLENCVANNLPFFGEVFMAMKDAVAQRERQVEQQPLYDITEGGYGDMGEDREAMRQQRKESKMQFGVALGVAAVELPDALGRCGLHRRQVGMLMDSVKAFFDGVQLSLSTPNEVASKDEITQNMGRTIKDWKNLDWYDFGFDLGRLFQNLLLTLFEQKYAVDDEGALKERLLGLGDEGVATAWGGGRNQAAAVVLHISALTALLLVAAMGMALWRERRRASARKALVPEFTVVAAEDVSETEADDIAESLTWELGVQGLVPARPSK